MLDLFSLSITSSWCCLYTTEFNGLFCYLLSLVRFSLHEMYFMATCTSYGDLFSTYTFSFWPIQYTRNFLMTFSVHIPTHIDLFSISTTSSGIVCTLVTFMAFFVYLAHIFCFVWIDMEANAAARSKLCSSVSAWLGVFAIITISSA